MGGSRCKHVIMVLLLIFTSVYATHTSILCSLNATVTGSTEHSAAFAFSHAVDGSTSTDSGACQCCAATVKEVDPWIQIDLGRLYRVSIIEVTGRTDDITDPFEGMHIYLHTEPKWQQNLAGNVTIPKGTGGDRYYNGTLENPVIAQYVTLQLSGNYVLLGVCEVSIYSRDCHSGYYGVSCGETCGRCLNNEVCDHVTGACTKCEAGYKGAVCKDECPAGTFGQDCSSSCHCLNNVTCDHVTGRCPDDRCDLGWHGLDCSKPCAGGHFGENCKELCGNCFNNVPCDKRDGTCTSCSKGYIGQQCKQECPTGTYGQDCSGTCGNCRERCDIINGTCITGCQDGYLGTFCKDNCPEGFHGFNCGQVCGHCFANTTCTFTTGHCEGGCEEGYYGYQCIKEVNSATDQCNQSPLTTAIVGGAAGMAILIVMELSVVGLVCLIRWRKMTPVYEQPRANWNRDSTREYATLDLPEHRQGNRY